MRHSLGRGLFATACLLAMVLGAAPAAMAFSPPEIGIFFAGTQDGAQCGVNQGTFWAPAQTWTPPIRFDTDNRAGGCELSFALRDTAFFSVPTLTYQWAQAGTSDPGQCGRRGLYTAPVNGDPEGQVMGPRILVDTDNRFGFCNLTLALSGSSAYQLDVQFWADGQDQCFNTAPQGQWHSVRAGQSLTLSIDTDGRPGGCQMAVRLSTP
jgi:hypothetical protein